MSKLGWPYEFEYGEEIKDVIKCISRINDEYMAKVAGALHDALEEFAANAERGGHIAQKIRALHQPQENGTCSCNGWYWRQADEVAMKEPFRYPCPTVKALGGGQE